MIHTICQKVEIHIENTQFFHFFFQGAIFPLYFRFFAKTLCDLIVMMMMFTQYTLCFST